MKPDRCAVVASVDDVLRLLDAGRITLSDAQAVLEFLDLLKQRAEGDTGRERHA